MPENTGLGWTNGPEQAAACPHMVLLQIAGPGQTHPPGSRFLLGCGLLFFLPGLLLFGAPLERFDYLAIG